METSYFSFAGYDWSMSVYPAGKTESQIGKHILCIANTVTHTVVAKKDKTTLLVILVTKSFYPFWPPLYVFFQRNCEFLYNAQFCNII